MKLGEFSKQGVGSTGETLSFLKAVTSPAVTSPVVVARIVELEPVTLPTGKPVTQTIRLTDGTQTLATLTWFTADPMQGVVILLTCEVEASIRRKGLGKEIFRKMRQIADTHFRAHGSRLRRVIAHADQKNHIHGRAWLTSLGFHHIHTLKYVATSDQDILVYLLGQD